MLSIWCMVDCIVHLYAVTLIHHMYKLHLILKNTGTLITLSFNKTTSELLPSDKFLMIFIIYSHTLAKLNTNTHLSTNKELSSPQHNCLFICCCCCMPIYPLCTSGPLHCLKKTSQLSQAVVSSKHGLILTIWGKHHQHTFKNYIRIQLSLSLHFYLLYLLLNSCDGNDATLAT